ncbi:O-antigen ligase [Erythrobacter sp.]|uniref:O-antigen ligase family protein n=1 Tax=Erythrobacter sp. TaxID=1042 RepID=UPI002600B304|nr:O-antigen ligase family protein [Erythrobacter sp.]
MIAALALLALPIFIVILRQSQTRRYQAFVAIGLLPLLSDWPLIGYVYGWPTWSGISKGFSLSFVVMLAVALIHTNKRKISGIPFAWIFILYAIAVIISVLNSRMYLASLFTLWQYLSVVTVFLAICLEADNPKVYRSILTGFAFGLIYQSGHVIWLKLNGVGQAAGTLGHQNLLGIGVELTMLPVLAAVLAGDRRPVMFAGLVAGLICIAGTGSRGTVGIGGGAAIILIFLSLARRPDRRKFGLATVCVLAVAIAAPFALGNLKTRFQDTSFFTTETERELFEDAARSMANNNPLGVGANQYVFVSNVEGYADRFGIPWQLADRSVPVHNGYLLARAETGRLGEWAFIIAIFLPLFAALKIAVIDRKSLTGDLLIGSAMALVAVAAHSFYEFGLHLFPLQLLFYMNLGLIAAEVRARRYKLPGKALRRVQGSCASERSMPVPSVYGHGAGVISNYLEHHQRHSA